MRIAVLIALVVAAVGCGAGASAPASPTAPTGTQLTISYWPAGKAEGGKRTWSVRCAPAAGTLPKPGIACRKLGAMTNPFAPLQKDLMCTDIYGGPQVALIKGTFRGRAISVLLQARNGCEIARFEKLKFLVPLYGGAGAS
ncbi:MAG: subtilase-type protease inhibitor, partial [Actinomycetota bacterium]|nr:subtilase-type protease inhibitor [Actinomycetota bacterium]